ncbi:YkvA family protein [Roseibium sp. Sym1]|uniref:YkvA family protein n=1 Tax=Roseibium sp. Sym1 TaxID=3016006 RepID=UPI0022B4E1ED|nr:DUF1232 domain-containing protein [Roseibium sp. Sym1]
MWKDLKTWAQTLKRDTIALYLAVRDPRTPWYAKAIAAVVVAYALSPIDLIPDFIPVLGYLDDILLVPIGLWIAICLVPGEVLEDCRTRARRLVERPTSRTAAFFVVFLWAAMAALAGWIILRPAVLSLQT